MTRPISKHRQEIETLQRELSQAKYSKDRAEEKVTTLEDEKKFWMSEAKKSDIDCDHWREKFNEACQLWNQWIEADKGNNPESKEAYITFDPEVFKQLLSLLRP